jgi:hypothetical protein
MRKLIAFAALAFGLGLSAPAAQAAGDCGGYNTWRGGGCAEGLQVPKRQAEGCIFIQFPGGRAAKPRIFFTSASDSRQACKMKNPLTLCRECATWGTKRGYQMVWSLLPASGVWVPAAAYRAGRVYWCDEDGTSTNAQLLR